MATDIIARGMAANVKKSVTALGNKIESEKWIGTKAEWEAVDKSTIKDGTIVYITDDETVILYDKAEMEKIAAKVATDRKAAETAAQTAQSVADSLPDDYVTAVGKIAENTAEIANVKLTDKELKRRVDALFDMGQGVTHKFETDSETEYQKTVPTGGKLMSVKSVGGRSVVWNQLFDYTQFVNSTTDGVTFTNNNDGTITIGGTHTSESKIYSVKMKSNPTAVKGHKYIIMQVYDDAQHIRASNAIAEAVSDGEMDLRFSVKPGTTLPQTVAPQVFDLTVMFGAGNEPASVEEFEKIFPAEYYPYNAGEIVSAGVTEVVVGDTAYPIPEAIRNLPGYGWSAGTAKNYVDYENKRYVQCVGNMDLGTLDWKFNTTSAVGNHFYAPAKHLNFKYLGAFGTTIYNALCSKYRTVARSSNVFVDKTLTIDGVTVVSQIQVKDTAYTDATAFKQAMQGVIMYYELESPIVTDISDLIDDDFLRNIEVEAGGSVTFKNSNDSYRIPVPSEEEYIVKLSEVGGTT